MNQFYLNNMVGAPSTVAEGSAALSKAVLAFCELVADTPLHVSSQVVIDKDPELTKFGDYYLKQLICEITNIDVRKKLYCLLNSRFPMEDYFEWDEEVEPFIEADYRYDGEDATNLAVVNRHKGLLLSIAFSESFKKDQIVIRASGECAETCSSEIAIDNLYGETSNINYIRQRLQEREGVEPNLFNEINELGIVHNRVENTFKKLTYDIQNSIIEGFREAKNQGLLKPHAGNGNVCIFPNDELVRFEQHTNLEKLFEVAIYHPLALRIFIAQHEGELYILDIKSKKELGDGGATQNAALRAAETRFKNMKKAL